MRNFLFFILLVVSHISNAWAGEFTETVFSKLKWFENGLKYREVKYAEKNGVNRKFPVVNLDMCIDENGILFIYCSTDDSHSVMKISKSNGSVEWSNESILEQTGIKYATGIYTLKNGNCIIYDSDRTFTLAELNAQNGKVENISQYQTKSEMDKDVRRQYYFNSLLKYKMGYSYDYSHWKNTDEQLVKISDTVRNLTLFYKVSYFKYMDLENCVALFGNSDPGWYIFTHYTDLNLKEWNDGIHTDLCLLDYLDKNGTLKGRITFEKYRDNFRYPRGLIYYCIKTAPDRNVYQLVPRKDGLYIYKWTYNER